MFDDEPMPAEVLCALLPMASQPGWATKWGIVTWVASFPEGTWADGNDLADFVGIAAGRCRMHLLQLTDARVLDRDGGPGGRCFWYRLNPRWWEWDIEWRHDRRGVEHRLALWEQRVRQPSAQRLSARPMGARYDLISARLWARAEADEGARYLELARANGRALFAEPTPGARAHRARANSGGARGSDAGSARPGRALPRPTAGGGVLPPVGDDDLAPPGAPAEPKEEERISISISDGDRDRAYKAVLAKAMPGPGRRKPAIWGRPIHQIEQLVAAHGIDAFVAAAGEVEARVDGVPRVIDHIAAHLATSAADDEPPAPAMMRPILERRRQGLAQLVATYEEQDLPVPDVHIADLQEVEAQLAKYDDQVSDHSAEGVTT